MDEKNLLQELGESLLVAYIRAATDPALFWKDCLQFASPQLAEMTSRRLIKLAGGRYDPSSPLGGSTRLMLLKDHTFLGIKTEAWISADGSLFHPAVGLTGGTQPPRQGGVLCSVAITHQITFPRFGVDLDIVNELQPETPPYHNN